MVIVSPLVTDGERIGEIFALDGVSYDRNNPEAYVVGDGWADWIAVVDLTLVSETANAETPAA